MSAWAGGGRGGGQPPPASGARVQSRAAPKPSPDSAAPPTPRGVTLLDTGVGSFSLTWRSREEPTPSLLHRSCDATALDCIQNFQDESDHHPNNHGSSRVSVGA